MFLQAGKHAALHSKGGMGYSCRRNRACPEWMRSEMRASRTLVLMAFTALALAGCATAPPADDPDSVAEFQQTNDPLEPTNRVFYAINNGLDAVLLRPLAVGYTYAVPEDVRGHVRSVLHNLKSPVLLANDILQSKPRRAGDTLVRFVVNSTVGVAGIFDVATDWGYPAHSTDFGDFLWNLRRSCR